MWKSSKTKYERPNMLNASNISRDKNSTSMLKSTKTVSTFSIVKEREPLKMRKAMGKKPMMASHKLIGQRKPII